MAASVGEDGRDDDLFPLNEDRRVPVFCRRKFELLSDWFQVSATLCACDTATGLVTWRSSSFFCCVFLFWSISVAPAPAWIMSRPPSN